MSIKKHPNTYFKRHIYEVDVIDPRTIFHTKHQAPKNIRLCLYKFVWINVPIRGKHIPPDKYSACLEEVRQILMASEIRGVKHLLCLDRSIRWSLGTSGHRADRQNRTLEEMLPQAMPFQP